MASSLQKPLVEAAWRGAWAPALVLGVHVPLSRFGLDVYDDYPLVDVPMHIAGGVAIAFMVDRSLDALQRHGRLGELSATARATIVIASTLAAALVWELAEFTVDRLFDWGAQRGTLDTVTDVLNGVIGGGAWVATQARRRK